MLVKEAPGNGVKPTGNRYIELLGLYWVYLRGKQSSTLLNMGEFILWKEWRVDTTKRVKQIKNMCMIPGLEGVEQ